MDMGAARSAHASMISKHTWPMRYSQVDAMHDVGRFFSNEY